MGAAGTIVTREVGAAQCSRGFWIESLEDHTTFFLEIQEGRAVVSIPVWISDLRIAKSGERKEFHLKFETRRNGLRETLGPFHVSGSPAVPALAPDTPPPQTAQHLM